MRASVVLPTDMYVKLAAEALSGSKLSSVEESTEVGVYSASLKVGNDFSESSSWQFGLSYLRNENGAVDSFEEHDHADDEEEDHSHAATVTGENLYGAEFVWKWAPNGNYKYRHFTLAAEYLVLDGIVDSQYEDDAAENLSAYYVSGVYRFNPSWSMGLRYSEAESYDGHAHDDELHFTAQTDKEMDLMVAWNSSHFGTVRAQYSHIDNQDDETDNVFTLQYVMTFGAHSAHAF